MDKNKILGIVLLVIAVVCFGLAIALRFEASVSPAIIGAICVGVFVASKIRNNKK